MATTFFSPHRRAAFVLWVVLAVLARTTPTSAWSFLGLPSWSVRTPSRCSSSSSSSTTRLYISSWGTKGSPYAGGATETLDNVNPEQNVQAYLPEPSAVEARSNVDGKCLVSGCVNAKDRTDQFMFDLLNDEDSAFEFTKIIAFVQDAKFSKKRLLSRSARYTGLLDKLDFIEQTNADSSLPTVEQLEGIKSWVAVLEDNHLEQMEQVAALAAKVESMQNIAILLVGATDLDAAASKAVLDKFPHEFNPAPPKAAEDGEGSSEAKKDEEEEPLVIPPKTFTIVAVGAMDDKTPEGQCYYQYESFGTDDGVIPSDAVFPRQESYRLITELLQLACGRQKALSFAQVYNANVTEARLIRGLREAGYARPQEIDHMIRQGPDQYLEFIEKWKKRNPDWEKGYTTDAWWEAEIYQQSRRKSAEREKAKQQEVVDERTKEVEAIAREWVKREKFRQTMAGTISDSTTDEEFKEQVWERAMFEADLKYREMKGEKGLDAEAELADFKSRQERKKQTMLKRAKKELAELLNEDPDKLIPDDDEDDDDDDDDDAKANKKK
ncbi:hypothetical protein ACA910_020916 [Epithemia clementina (nom. ined.)]